MDFSRPRRSDAMILACPVCGSTSRNILFRAVPDYITDRKFDLTLCNQCSLGITAPMPDDAQIGEYYSASYRGDRHAFTDRMRIALRSRALAKYFPPGFRGRLLDIGCGEGAFAIHQKELGWNVAVTEIHEPTLQRLRARGIAAFSPRDAVQIAGPFDAVTCWHVLEHALQPDALARWVRSILGTGGIFQVAVPNLQSWQARASGRHWLHLDMPRHRYHFDSHTLRKLLTAADFEIAAMHTVVVEYDWFGAIQSLLNALCARPNVLFEMLTARNPTLPRKKLTLDRAVSLLLAPLLAAATLPACLVAGSFAAGATLDITARPASKPAQPS
jgi:2-polyprenyl-3-methyl-5-hydroxy-6-metoxy-1,4-benzoquinol methylase